MEISESSIEAQVPKGIGGVKSIHNTCINGSSFNKVLANGIHNINKETKLLNTMDHGANSWVRLNVGGKIFQTTRHTLMKESDSFLYRLCQDDEGLPSMKDESGAYMIDRDADYFSPVLNYLRHGKLVINPGISEDGVLEEAEFYNLPHLVQLVNERINERDTIRKERGRVKSVYRVLQCHEEELTNVVSAMSDGWKIVQVMPVQSKYQDYSADQQQEYLCIVVRECPDNGSMNESQDRAKLLQQKARHN